MTTGIIAAICKLFGHKMDRADIADFICLRCGEHFKIEWPKPKKIEGIKE